MRSDTFFGHLIAALARDTPAFRSPHRAEPRTFASLLMAFSRNTSAFLDRMPIRRDRSRSASMLLAPFFLGIACLVIVGLIVIVVVDYQSHPIGY
jgi:Fe2+ transport system protein B